MASKDIVYEKKKAKKHGGKHIGGPGKPDYTRGNVNGEVKDWNRKMGKADVKREAQKGRNEIVSKKGFTPKAIDYANQYRPGVKLIDGKGTVVKARKKKKK